MKGNLLITVLQALKIPYTADYADELFESHPYRHTLLGLSQMLKTYGVENVGMQLDDKSQLAQLPRCPGPHRDALQHHARLRPPLPRLSLQAAGQGRAVSRAGKT